MIHLRQRLLVLATTVILLLGLTTGCKDDTNDDPQLGGESHWLQSCEADAECGDLACHCGVCSLACQDNADCSAFGTNAECALDPTTCSATCLPDCDGDEDCTGVGDANETLSCVNGSCQRSVPCGPSICTGIQVCCNSSCGVCTDPGEACTAIGCEPE